MTPRHAAPDNTEPLTLVVTALMRDTRLDIIGHVTMNFIYDPADPYALEMVIRSPFQIGEKRWTASREVFCVAALWGIELPGLDLTVTPVVVSRARPGHATREVPCLRVTLREFVDCGHDMHHFTGHVIHFDITTSEVRDWFALLTQVVRIGSEHKHIDIDADIAALLDDPSYKEGS